MKQNTLHITFLLIACCLCGKMAVIAQNVTDSVKTYQISEVVVTGTRNATDIRHLSQTVSIVGRPMIENAMQPSVLPMLTEKIPGLFVTRRGVMGYGVSDGAAGGISLRGLSSGSGRIMVLIDGHPQYAGIFGHPIADSYQSMLTERIEVLRGPASVLYGSNAMGGVINIVTRQMREDGVLTNLHAGYGSYNTFESELTNRIRKGKFYSVLSGSYNYSDGHRGNMNFEQYGGYAKFGYDISAHWNLYADLNITHFNASYPGPVSMPLEDGDQRITRGVTSFAIQNQYDKTSGGISFFYNFGNHFINDGYTPRKGEVPQNGRFCSFDDMMGVSLYQSAQFFRDNRLTFGFDWFRYGGKAWTQFIAGENAGTTRELVNKHENEVAGYIDFRQNISWWFTCNLGFRLDYHTQAGIEWVPQAGLAFHLPYDIELKLSATKGFRYPILREMYMFPPQNPDLKPESMWNYELAFSQSLLHNRLHYGINIFYIDAKNIIMRLPNPNGTGMLNQNSGKLNNAGVEVQFAYQINSRFAVDANYSFLHMKTPVVAAPEHKLYLGGDFTMGKWSLSTGILYIAGLYTSVNPDITESFVLWNLRAQYRLNDCLTLWLRGDNLLAQQYEINAGYPMPGLTVMGGFNINF